MASTNHFTRRPAPESPGVLPKSAAVFAVGIATLYGSAQVKFAASSILPLPLYFAICG